MKKPLLVLLILFSLRGLGQNCKPDLSNSDKITKQQNIAWQSTLFESGFGNSLINTSDWFISVQFGRYGSNNLFTVFIDKYEESAQNAAFESQYQGLIGQDIYIAFTQGEPLRFSVQSANTVSKMNNMLGKLVTTITLGVPLTPQQIEDVKRSFGSGTANVIRIGLANNMRIEKDIKEKKAKKLGEKAQCFLDYNEKNPIKASSRDQISGDIAKSLPRDNRNKVSFEEAISVDSATKDQLYQRAKNWMMEYYKDAQIKLDLPANGQLSRSGMFIKTFKAVGAPADDEMAYTISIAVKDGKYKYTITDIIVTEGARKAPIETILQIGEKMPALLNEANQVTAEGAQEVIKSLKIAMVSDLKAKSDW